MFGPKKTEKIVTKRRQVGAPLGGVMGNCRTESPRLRKQRGNGRLPSPLLEPFRSLSEATAEFLMKESLFPIVASQSCQKGIDAISDYVQRHFGRPTIGGGYEPIVGGICIKSPGLPTVTCDPNTEALAGLHVDDWYKLPLGSREEAPNRMCINLGSQDRFFLFLPVSITQIHGIVSNSDPGSNQTSVGRAFMRLFPCYPIVRFRIRPGEAYIAPTENVVHDGSSTEMSCLDASFSLRGRFELYAYNSL
jgi:hypothetical protein